MIILGVDPGTRNTGFGVIDFEKNSSTLLHFGSIKLDGEKPISERLVIIYSKLTAVIEAYKPKVIAVETAFYAKNISSTMKLGHARGVILLAAAQSGAQILEISPREIKRHITGNGNASKEQVAKMVQLMLKLTDDFPVFDMSDAIAIAFSAGYEIGPGSSQFKKITQSVVKKKRSSWSDFIGKNEHRVIQ